VPESWLDCNFSGRKVSLPEILSCLTQQHKARGGLRRNCPRPGLKARAQAAAAAARRGAIALPARRDAAPYLRGREPESDLVARIVGSAVGRLPDEEGSDRTSAA